MGRIKGGLEHAVVSTNTALVTTACRYYGCTIVNKTTAGVQVLIYDAKATAQGNLTDILTVAAGTNNNQGAFYTNGIIMHSGLYISALVCTTAADSIIIYYGGI